MELQIRTDHSIEGQEALFERAHFAVARALDRFGDRIIRVDVHLTDEDGDKHGHDDKRCMIEASLAGHPALAVTDHASKLDKAIDGAAAKMSRLIAHTIGRIHDQDRQHVTAAADPAPATLQLKN